MIFPIKTEILHDPMTMTPNQTVIKTARRWFSLGLAAGIALLMTGCATSPGSPSPPSAETTEDPAAGLDDLRGLMLPDTVDTDSGSDNDNED